VSSSVDNLIQGPGHIYVAPYGTALPAAADLASLMAGTLSGWSSVGETTAAVDIVDTPTWVKATSQQQARDLDASISAIATTVKTTLREVTEARLSDLIRGTMTTGTNADSFAPAGIGPAPKFSLVVVGPWPGGQSVALVAERVIYSAAQTLSFDNTKYTEVAVEFEILTPSDSGPVGGYTVYVTKPAA